MLDQLQPQSPLSAALDARVDITDQYVFQDPHTPERTILVMDVNPLAPVHANEFRHNAVYEVLIDTDNDARPNIAFRYRFSRKEHGRQRARATRAELELDLQDGHLEGENNEEVLVEDAPVSFETDAQITVGKHAVRLFAGLRSDPFFFDLLGFLNGLNFTASDFYRDKNVFALVLDVPTDMLGPNSRIGVWSRTLVPMLLQPDHLTQADQVGRPAIGTLLTRGSDTTLLAATWPAAQRTTVTANGQTFLQLFQSQIERLGGHSPADALALAEMLLPDVLRFDYSSPAEFFNGRRLQDDVIDSVLKLITNGGVTSDGVGPHADYLPDFPYLGNPHIALTS